jgi:hypothetical protein
LQASYFGAQKFCRSRGLTLGTADVKSKEIEIISLVRPSGKHGRQNLVAIALTNSKKSNGQGQGLLG